MTMRLSISSLAGTARTLVAVGTARLAAMLAAVRAAAPRSRISAAPGTAGRQRRPRGRQAVLARAGRRSRPPRAVPPAPLAWAGSLACRRRR